VSVAAPALAEPPPAAAAGGGERPGPQLEPSGGRLFGVSVGQIICWEVAVAAVLAGAVRRDWTLVPAVLFAGAVGSLTLVRRRGRWLYEALAVRLRYRARGRGRPADDPADLRLAALRELRPELDVSDVEQRSGQRLGVCYDGSGWVGVVAVQAGDDVLPDPQQPAWLSVRELAAALVVDDIALASVQLLCHVAPAPSGTLPANAPVATSYQRVKASSTPASQQVWIALRLDPARCPEAIEARGGGTEGARRALKRCLARTLELLESAGVRGRALDGEALRAALTLAGATRPVPTPPGARRTAETWAYWQADEVVHITWWVAAWPSRLIPMQLLTEAAASVSALSCVLSLSLHPAPAGSARFRGMIRVTAVSPPAAEIAADALQRATAAVGIGLYRLDGEQALGYAATLPLGGGQL
jgi:type VII secretion protein EccE